MISSKVLLCPVTAVKYLKHVILTGEGPWLHVYDVDTGHKVQSNCIFVDAAVHGIVCVSEENLSDRLICVFGSKQLRILQLNQHDFSLTFVTDVIEVVDWIWNMKWLHETSSVLKEETSNEIGVLHQYSLVCVLGHNSVLNIKFSNKMVPSKKEIHCEEKCIVYCAHCIGNTWDNLVVASGTVFNQVVLWKPSVFAENGRSKVLHRLIGHEGVIFSIDYNFELDLIASVSDDRSIRLWKIENQNSVVRNDSENKKDAFENSQCFQVENVQIKQQNVWYGHSARVWKVKILKDYIVSVGEDCTCSVWNYDGQIVRKYKGHKGKSIWSFAVSEDEKSMVTGGGDCSVRIWSLNTEYVGQNVPRSTEVLRLPEIQEDYFPRIVTLLNQDIVLTMTNEGILWSYDVKNTDVTKVLDDDRFKSYSVLSCLPYSKMYAVGSIHGIIKIFCNDDSLEKEIYKGKVHNILWLYDKENVAYQSDDTVVLTSGPDGTIDIWQVDWLAKDLRQLYHFILPYTKQRWVSAVILLQQQELLVCGDRGGTVHVYSITKESNEPINSFWKIHGKSGVTDLCSVKEKMYSAGRDGQYRVYNISAVGLQLLSSQKIYKGFEWIAQLKMKDNDVMVLGFHADNFIVYSTATNQKLVTIPCGGGHRAWDFALDNEEYSFVYLKNRDVVHCRGQITSKSKILKHSLHGRELCDIRHLFSDNDIHVVVTAGEDTDVNVLALSYKDNLSSTKLLATLQGHLSSVRALALTNSCKLCSNQKNEDALLADIDGDFCNKLLFSGGGRAEIKVWNIFVCKVSSSPLNQGQKKADNSIENVKTEDVSCSHEYLGTHSLSHKRKQGIKPWQGKDYNPNPETRYMDLCVIAISHLTDDPVSSIKHLHIVVAASSDSLVRVIAFNQKTRKFQILAECCYHEHCVLKVKSFKVKHVNNNETKVYILSAATDGKCAIWDFTSILKAYVKHQLLTSNGQYPLDTLTNGDSLLNSIDLGEIIDVSVPVALVDVHQSGVNALDILYLSENEILVATGGDDNAITLTKVQIFSHNNKDLFNITSQCKTLQVHAAQVTGLKWMTSSSLLSVSIDQRLIIWQIDDNLNMKMKECKFVNISDVSNIDMWNIGSSAFSVGLCGVGLQCLNVTVE